MALLPGRRVIVTTTPTRRYAVKVRRQVWIEAEHPRDRKGRWIETGAEVRAWAGWLGTVIRNVGGGRIEVARKDDGRHVIIHRNYLTVTARPDGSAPTNSRDVNPAALPEGAASPDATDAEVPPGAPDVDAPATSGNLYDLLVGAGDQSQADLVRQAARDYQGALGNGVPDDEADERDGLLHVLDEVEATYAYDSEDKPQWDSALALLREAAEAEPPATDSEFTPVSRRFTPGGARQIATALDEATASSNAMPTAAWGSEHGLTVDGEKVTVTDPDAAAAFVASVLPISDAVAENEALPEVLRTSFVLRSEALRTVQQMLAQVAPDAKPGYNEDGGGQADERTGAASTGALGEVPPGGDQEPERPGDVLPRTGDGSGASDRGTRGDAEGTRPARRDVGAEASPVLDGPVERGGDDQARGGVPAGGEPGAGAPGGRDTDEGADGLRGREAGVPDGDGTGAGAGGESRLEAFRREQAERQEAGESRVAVGDALEAIKRGDRVTVTPRVLAGMVNVLAGYDQTGDDEYDLGLVTIEGTDLFAGGNLGVARADMPQLSGKPIPGGLSEGKPTNTRGNVNVKPVFLDRLREQGVNVQQENVPVATLHASQSDLNGPAVGHIYLDMRAGVHDGTGTIVTNDGYVLDGHHQWAAQVAIDATDGELGNLAVPMTRIDVGIEEALDLAREVSAEHGILPAGIGRADTAGTERVSQADVDAALERLRDGIPADEPDASEPEMTRINPDREAFEEQRAAEQVDWEALGAEAFERGEPNAPALSEDVQNAIVGMQVGDPEASRIMRDYGRGWLAANLAAPVPDVTDDVVLTREQLDADLADLDVVAPEPWVPPVLPDLFTELAPGTRIKVGYENFAKDVTFTGTGLGRRVFYVDDEGVKGEFSPFDGEKPRAAPPNVVAENLWSAIIASEITEHDEDGAPHPVFAPRVGSWRTRVDPDTDEGVITITGAAGVTGTMRATVNGWAGRIDTSTPGHRYGPDPAEPLRVPPNMDPQTVIDGLYDVVNGPGAADRTRNEVSAGRPLAPEVSPSYDTLPKGSRIRLEVDGVEEDVIFSSGHRQNWSSPPVWVVMGHRLPSEDYPEGQYVHVELPSDARPVAGHPQLGTEADIPEAEDPVTGPAYAPDVHALSGVVAGQTRFEPTGADDFAQAGTMTKLDANLAALRTLRDLRDEHRPATPEEQSVLARWAGWGGLSDVFDPTKTAFEARRTELYGLLDDGEIREARRNTLNAHYTDAEVVKRIWAGVQGLGLTEGRVLEPGSGSGTFIGFRPEGVDMVGVELDSTTAAISKHLYPDADIRNESFAHTNVPSGAFDGAVGNVPFGRFALHDPIHNPEGHSIHNHFILKTLEFTRPGGIVALLTSRYTLDSLNSEAREQMAEKADLIGAIRLPNGSHQRVAGTDVIEDLLIFRKREDVAEGEEAPSGDQSWLTSSKRPVNGWDVSVNHYFDGHPEHVMGDLTAAKGQFGGEVRVDGDKTAPGLADALDGIVESARQRGLLATARPADAPLPSLISAGSGRYEGHIQQEQDGSFTQATGGASVPFEPPVKQREELVDLLGLRDNLMALLDAEAATGEDTDQIAGLRASLNENYDAYVAKYGPVSRFTLNKRGSRKPPTLGGFRSDPKSDVVKALEVFTPPTREDPQGFTGTATKAAIFTTRAVAPRAPRTTADNPADALTLVMDQHGYVNLPAVARLLGTDEDDARRQLGLLVFEVPPLTDDEQLDAEQAHRKMQEDPTAVHLGDLGIGAESLTKPGTLIPAAEYLSGNVRKKMAAARVAAEHDPRYGANVEALAGVIPRDLASNEIEPRLGAAWIPADVIETFANETLGLNSWDRQKAKVSHSGGSIWTVQAPRNHRAVEEWGTEKRPFNSLLRSLLEQRPIVVTTKGAKDVEATLAAQSKAEEIQARFIEWLWEDPDRARRLTARYNEQFNSIALRTYDGSGRAFEGMSEEWQRKVQPHVKDAVERIVQEPTAMLAHVVGAGKTAEMVMGTAELKRLGLARKPAIVVPNHMLEQFTREYLEIYPAARILTAGQGMKPDERRAFVARAATGDWDAVIMTQGSFEAIPMSPAKMEAYIESELASMRAQMEMVETAVEGDDAPKNDPRRSTVKKMEAAILSAEKALRERLEKVKDLGVSFEQTGIDYLMVDEAHMYSNLRTLSNIQGAAASGSNKATDLHMKMGYLRETSQSGRVATFATGTPIRNTVTQAYIMVKYLRPDLLEEAGVHTFDQWAGTFGEVVEEMELKPEGEGFRNTSRFAKFKNVPEFLRMFHTFADVKMREDLNLPTPSLSGGAPQTVAVPRTDAQGDYIRQLGDRAEDVRAGKVDPSEDNMLKISTDGRKAALSMALVQVGTTEDGAPIMGTHEPGKLEAAADRIHSIYEANKNTVYGDDPIPGALQIVFMDMGTPKGTRLTKAERDEQGLSETSVDDDSDVFAGYDHLKDELVARGVPEEKIRYIHEAKNDAEKAEIFAAAKDGRIAVLLGSSEKMGVGTNVQRRAKALHHLDAPWRPADVEQRDGRIWRQGNLHMNMGEDVDIIRYVTEGSFDAYMWQTLERKAKFINQIMRGSLDVREIEDVGDTAMSYAEVKALALGKPDFLHKAKADTQVAKLARLQRSHQRTQANLASEVGRLSEQADNQERLAAEFTAAAEGVEIPPTFSMHVLGDTFGTGAAQAPDPDAAEVEGVDLTGERVPESSGRNEAGAALRTAIVEHRKRGPWNARDAVPLGSYGGRVITMQNYSGLEGETGVYLRVQGVDYVFARLGLDNLREGMGRGIVSRIENAVGGLARKRDSYVADAATNRAEVARMRDRIGLDFPQEAALAAWKKRAERLDAKIKRDDARDVDGADIPYDPTIDSDEFDDPITKGSAETFVPPPEEAPARETVLPGALSMGNMIEYVASEVSGVLGEGEVVGIKTVGTMTFVSIRTADGNTIMRAYGPGSEVVRLGSIVSVTGVKGHVIERRLLYKDGKVVVQIEAKLRGKFDEAEHPRDRQGRFIEKGAEVRIWGGGIGKITEVLAGGRVRVQRTDGKLVDVDAGNVTVTKTPQGRDVTPTAAPNIGAPGADTDKPATIGALAATEAAPGATPGDAVSTFTGPKGERAWLNVEDGQPVGYRQDAPDAEPVKYADPKQWAEAVDSAQMDEDADGGSAESARSMAQADTEEQGATDAGPGLRAEDHSAWNRGGAAEDTAGQAPPKREGEHAETPTEELRTLMTSILSDPEDTRDLDSVRDELRDRFDYQPGDVITLAGKDEQWEIVEGNKVKSVDDGRSNVVDLGMVMEATRDGQPVPEKSATPEGPGAPTTPGAPGEPVAHDFTEHDALVQRLDDLEAEHGEDDAEAGIAANDAAEGMGKAKEALASGDTGAARQHYLGAKDDAKDAGDVDLAHDIQALADALDAKPEPFAPPGGGPRPESLDELDGKRGAISTEDADGNFETYNGIITRTETGVRVTTDDGKTYDVAAEDVATAEGQRDEPEPEPATLPDAGPPADQGDVPNKPPKPLPVPTAPYDKADTSMTPVAEYGMDFDPASLERPDVAAAKADDGMFEDAPLVNYPMGNVLHATEEALTTRHITKIQQGEALREGYDPFILRTDDGDFVIDGHHRVGMHAALGSSHMPARLIDARTNPEAVAPNAETEEPIDLATIAPNEIETLSDSRIAAALKTAPAADMAGVLRNELSRRAQARATKMLSDVSDDEPQVTSLLSTISARFGGKLEGLHNRVKSVESLARKIRDKALLKGISQDESAAAIKDALRYTMTVDADDYSESVTAVMDEFKALGYVEVDADNTWGRGQVYQGINAAYRTPDGVTFEVQFHTPESFTAKRGTHADYEISRDPTVSLEERQAAHDRMVALQESNPIPPGVEDVGNIKAGVPRPTPQTPGEYRQVELSKIKTNQNAIAALDLGSAKPIESVDLQAPLHEGLVADLAGGSMEPFLIDTPEGKRLNPERAELHQRIIAHMLDEFEAHSQPRYNVLGGGSGSGKSTLVAADPSISEGNVVINPDDIKAMLPEYLTGMEEGNGDAPSFAHEESSYLAKMVQAEAFGRKVSVTLDGTGDSSASKMIGKIEDARRNGYAVNGYYVTSPTDEAVRRAALRQEKTGRGVPESVIRGTHTSVSRIFETIVPSFDSLVLVDSYAPPGPDGHPAMVALKEPGGGLKIIDYDLYQQFLAKAAE